MGKQNIKANIAKHREALEKMALDIWAKPEAGFREFNATKLQQDYLKNMGAKITSPVDVVETAFIAEYGSGKPIIGILGEFDALPGLSQKAGLTVQDPLEPGAYGHACGHNLLGTAGVLAFAALMDTMKEENLPGTLRFYACPAEENLSGKSYMARAGVFNDLDCCLTYHPGNQDAVSGGSNNAYTLMEFYFKGIPAHAGGAPWLGRSALDAVELMNVGCNYLREHIIDGGRMHYIIIDGGMAPNIVPATAAVRYSVRAPKMDQMQDIVRRLILCAEGAAHMTETTMTYSVKSVMHNMMPNYTMNEIMHENLCQVTPTEFTDEEKKFMDDMVATYAPEAIAAACKQYGFSPAELEHGMRMKPVLYGDKSQCSGGSTDVGDVSYITPTAQFTTACAPIPVSAHTWQSCSCYGTSVGTKGMIRAGEAMALTGYDLFTDKKDVIEKAKEELKADLDGATYTPIPDDMMPYYD